VETCWRNIREGISVLAGKGRRISLADVAQLAVKMGWDYLIVDGVHVPTVTFGRKTGGQKAFHSGKHKRHGVNVQTVCSPDGELLWASAAQPGRTVDITAARRAGLAAVLVLLIGSASVRTGTNAAERLNQRSAGLFEHGDGRLQFTEYLSGVLDERPLVRRRRPPFECAIERTRAYFGREIGDQW
jgi:hypothetical protein